MLLRPYQQEAIDATIGYWRSGQKGPLVVLPTGAGKGPLAAFLAAYVVKRGGRVLIMAHRSELVAQNAKHCATVMPGVSVGVWAAQLKQRTVGQVTCAMRDSVAGYVPAIGRIDLVIVDECHLISTKEQTRYARILSEVRQARPGAELAGLTATPYRADQGYLTQGDGALFSAVAYEAKVRALLDDGWLANIVTGDPTAQIDTSAVKVRGGEFVAADLELAADLDEVTQAVADDVKTALTVGGRRSAMVFATGAKHCAHLVEALRGRSLRVASVTQETTADDRRQIIADFKAHTLDAIVNIDTLTTGFDAPNVDVLAVARPTQSASLHVQIIGRGLRPVYACGMVAPDSTRDFRLSQIAAGPKANGCLLLDYGGNLARHGPIDDVRVKEKKQGGGEAPQKLCPKCYRPQPTSTRVCVCGHEFPPPEKKANKQASRLPAIGAHVERHADITITYREHVKEGRAPMLRVDYASPLGRLASEFIGVEDRGWAGEQAWRWWAKRVGGEPYATTRECLEHLQRHGARAVSWIEIARKGKYPEVTHVELG